MNNKMKINQGIAFVFFVFLLAFTGCKKEVVSALETGTVTDNQSNIYTTVKIGEQWWMTENLKTNKYNDGSAVEHLEADTALWANNITGAYCNGAYGLLYNWYAVNSTTHSITPTGWHIPTDEDWKKLEQHLGMSADDANKINWRGTIEGEKLKLTGVNNWLPYQDVWATNESGFSAQAGNCRLFNGKGGDPIGSGYMGFWWSDTETSNTTQAWYRYLDYKNANVFRFYGPKTYGFSVRCIKD